MINFRYHVVSLTAVFLALAIGLVVGTAALNGPVADSLKENVNALRKDNQQMRQTVNSLQKELDREEDFAAESAQVFLPGKLTGRRVLVLDLPSGRDHTEGVVKMLQLAGANVSRVDVQDKFINPDSTTNNNLLELAVTAARPNSVSTANLPGNGHGVETSSALLASVLLDRPQGSPQITDADRRAVLQAYTTAGYLTPQDKISRPAEAVVLVSGQPYVDKDSAKKDESVVKIAEQFDRTGAIVVGGMGSVGGNVVAVVRGDPVLSQSISTVDDANTVQGQFVTALALLQQLTEKKAGQYGVGDNAAGGLLPKLPQ
ncbi:copper transporter [Micromonospora sp. SL1-18]|uniref:copper transporter n=1 Tax=Micromonospora sp. SL1-18 TaxID=3399128 RepID=UPI003A4E5219